MLDSNINLREVDFIMCKVYKRIGAVFCTFGIILMFIAGMMFNTSAAGQTSGSLTLKCVEEGVKLADMTWSIYKVGERKENSYSLTGNFADYPVDLSKIMQDTESMTEAASTLSNFAVLDVISPNFIKRTDSNGIVKFNNLVSGLYLAVGNKVKIGSTSYFPTPFLVGVEGEDIESYPKFITKYTLPGAMDRFSLRKIWANATIVNDVPDTLTIEIYQDNELFDTVTISAETDWTYSWEGDASSEWRVKEITVPAGCYVMYRNNEIQFVIMNTYDSDMLMKAKSTTTTATVSTAQTETAVVTNGSQPATSETTKNVMTDIASATTDMSNTVPSTTVNTLDHNASDTNTVPTSAVSTFVQNGQSTETYPTDTNGSTIVQTYPTDTNGSTIIETYPTDTNGSTITTVATEKDDDSYTQPPNSSKDAVVTTTPEKLPQTGQLWWPVPVMLIGGLIFLGIGLRLILDSRKED